jgi:hypothetical protein
LTSKRIEDLVNVETEHLLSATTYEGRVVLRCQSDATVLLGQLTPEQARDVAAHLVESAARSEYEQDLWGELTRVEMDERAIGLIFHAVRAGEIRRHTDVEGNQ